MVVWQVQLGQLLRAIHWTNFLSVVEKKVKWTSVGSMFIGSAYYSYPHRIFLQKQRSYDAVHSPEQATSPPPDFSVHGRAVLW